MKEKSTINTLNKDCCKDDVGFAFVSKQKSVENITVESVYQKFSHKYRKSLNKLSK